MSTIVQRRRGTTAEHSTFTGALGEITIDTDKDVAVVHNAVLAGGFPLAGTLFANVFEEPQTVSLPAGSPTAAALSLITDSVNRVTFRQDGYGIFHRQEADAGLGGFDFTKRGTTGNSLAALSSGSGIAGINFRGWDGTALSGTTASLRVFTSEAWTAAAHGTKMFFLTTPIGSLTATTSATLNSTEFEVMSRLLLPNTTSATVGGIYFGGNRAFHNFGTNNTFVGVNAGNLTMTGGHNSFFGYRSGIANTTGIYNAFFGRNSGAANTTGNYNSFFGSFSGINNTTASNNSFFGYRTGILNTTGASNSFFGRSAGAANTTGANNSFFGLSTGQSNTTGARNSFFGTYAGFAGTTGNNNTFFGFQAGNNLTTGSNNIVLGYDIDSPTATNSNTLTIGNLIFGTGIDGTGTTISSGNVGIAVITPLDRLHIIDGGHIRLGNAAVAGAVVPTHTVTIKDSTGTVYRVPCLV